MIKELKLTRRVSALSAAIVLALASLVPLLSMLRADAAQITSRSVTIDKSYINATDVEFDFQFTIPSTAHQEGIIYRFCTTPLGACTVPTGMDLGADTITSDAQSGWPTNATNWALATANENDCQETTNSTFEICFERTEATPTTPPDVVTHTISGITAPSANQTVYVRIFLYSDPDFQTVDLTDEGVVAAAFVNQLTVTARVQERLVFCVGTLNDVVTPNNDCTDISGTTEDLGAVDFLAVCVTGATNPCDTNNPSDTDESYALIATNAQEGVLVTYYAEQDATPGAADHLGTLRIPGADCDTVPSAIDQCFNAAGTTATAIVAGTEEFGMTVSSVDTSKGGLTTNLTRDTAYDGDGTSGGVCTAANAGTDEPCWTWDETGTIDTIATSSSVLDDEMLVIQFAATAALTTPTGQYSVTSTYVATPTF